MARNVHNAAQHDESLFRGLDDFLRRADANGKLDTASEAAQHAHAIDRCLKMEEHEQWLTRFGTSNLKAWHGILTGLSDEQQFARWRTWKPEANTLRTYLMDQHFYGVPTRFIHQDGRNPRKRYLESPLHPRIEQEIVALCETAGSAKKVIRFIAQLEKSFPDEFSSCWKPFSERKELVFDRSFFRAHHGWRNTLSSTDEPGAFDGRTPDRMAAILATIRQMIGRRDFLAFTRRVDGILGWRFSFQKANAYFRFHDRWIKEGEAFFACLERRQGFLDLLANEGVADRIEEDIIARVTESKERTEMITRFVRAAGEHHFFDPSLNNTWAFMQFGMSNYRQSDEVRWFLDTVEKRGEGCFADIHRAAGLSTPPTLRLREFYELFWKLEKANVKDVEGIMRILRTHIFDAHRVDDTAIDIAGMWYTPFMKYISSNLPQFHAEKDLIQILDTLHQEGLLDSTLTNLREGYVAESTRLHAWLMNPTLTEEQERLLDDRSLRGLKIDAERLESESRLHAIRLLMTLGRRDNVNVGGGGWHIELSPSALQPETIEQQSFWITKTFALHQMMEDRSMDYWWGYSTHRDTLTDHLYRMGEKKDPPTDEVNALQAWVQKMGERYPRYPNPRNEIWNELFFHIMLSANGGLPPQEELDFFEQKVFASTLSTALDGGRVNATFVDIVQFYSRSPIAAWKQFPQAMRWMDRLIERDVRRGIFANRSWFDDPEVMQSIARFDAAVGSASIDALARMERLFFSAEPLFPIHYKWDGGSTPGITDFLSLCMDALTGSDETLEALLQTIARAEEKPEFGSFKGFERIRSSFDPNNPGALVGVFQQWRRLGLSPKRYRGEKGFLHLTEGDERHIQTYAQQIVQREELRFYELPFLLGVEEERFIRWLDLDKTLRERKLDVSHFVSMELVDLPHVVELFAYLNEEGLLVSIDRRLASALDPNTHPAFRVSPEAIAAFKKMLAWCAEHIDEMKQHAGKLKERFAGYFFNELGGTSALGTMQDFVRFKEDFAGPFFDGNAPWNDLEVVVFGNRADRHATHPFLQDTPGFGFTMHDHALYTHIASERTYTQVMNGQRRAELIENLLVQFTGLPTRPRSKNKLYADSESVSRTLLNGLPTSKLIRIQWLLNNLADPRFRREIIRSIDADWNDRTGEHGGIVMPREDRRNGIADPFEPMTITKLPSKNWSAEDPEIRKLIDQIARATNPDEQKKLIVLRDELLDGGYGPNEGMKQTRFGWSMHWHQHAVHHVGEEIGSYAGPSGSLQTGGDIGSAVDLGDGIVITRLGDERFNVDLYGVYPASPNEGPLKGTKWNEYVIDLGVYGP